MIYVHDMGVCTPNIGAQAYLYSRAYKNPVVKKRILKN